jgi:nucleoside-diphosphate-sugar epimerase
MKLDHDGRAIADIIGAAVRGEDIILNSDGSALRSYCYISDVVSGILHAIQGTAQNRTLNLSNDTEPLSIRSLAELTVSLFPEKQIGVSCSFSVDAAAAYSSVDYIPLDTGALRQLGWSPRVTLKDGLLRTVRSFAEDL